MRQRGPSSKRERCVCFFVCNKRPVRQRGLVSFVFCLFLSLSGLVETMELLIQMEKGRVCSSTARELDFGKYFRKTEPPPLES